jgi:deoxyribodipyrimidine photo-lyase
MKNINSYRKFEHNNRQVNPDGEYVLYWMQINRRLHYNYAIDFAVAWANKLGKRLLIYEGLSASYPWASDRFHTFIMQGMRENLAEATSLKVNYFSYVEPMPEAGKGLLYQLAEKACCVISDEYPVYIIRKHNERVAGKINIPFTTIDSNGIIPLGITKKEPYSAFHFRKVMQKHFLEAFTNPPKENPLAELEKQEHVQFTIDFLNRFPTANGVLENIAKGVANIGIDHSVEAIALNGTRKAALDRLHEFVQFHLPDYSEKRNHPDANKSSRLSGWLHFGKISAYEVVKAALDAQPEDWQIGRLMPNNGKREGFFGGDKSIEAFLDEVITWREVGFHFAHHRPDYDELESLPGWVHETMNEHKNDVRNYVYTLEEFEWSQTHDEIWNAAQNQLREEGIIQNYLRMLWGKKIIEWTPDYQTALDYLIHLNNKYAVDGRDPNSYSGIFWCLGRFDRAWQERPIFGKLRYMSSESARKKVRLTNYLNKYGRQKKLML